MKPEPWRTLAAGLGSGRVSSAPGTVGTLAAVPLVWTLAHLPLGVQLLLLVATLPAAAFVCGRAAADEGAHDPAWIVLDEMVGYWVAVFALTPTLPVLAAGFVAFRVFDIWKPAPIRWIDRGVGGGWGIVLDDVAAGLAARLVLGLTLHWGWL